MDYPHFLLLVDYLALLLLLLISLLCILSVLAANWIQKWLDSGWGCGWHWKIRGDDCVVLV